MAVVIYDCDGVLFDSRSSNEAFYNHILERFRMPPLGPEQLDFVHMSTSEEAIDYLFEPTPFRQVAQAYRESMDYRPFIPMMRLEPHAREVVACLRPDYRTAIATNRGKSIPGVLRFHDLEGLFDLVVSALDVKGPKPDPECLEKILHHFHLSPSEALYVGDGEVDQLVAQRAGVPFAAYKNPRLKAEYLFMDHRDVLEVLRTSAP